MTTVGLSAGVPHDRPVSKRKRACTRDDEYFPWADVDASRNDAELQAGEDAAITRQYIDESIRCPRCSQLSDQLTWFYFKSPDWTWENLCGQAGWMAVCDACHLQVTFSCTVMN